MASGDGPNRITMNRDESAKSTRLDDEPLPHQAFSQLKLGVGGGGSWCVPAVVGLRLAIPDRDPRLRGIARAAAGRRPAGGSAETKNIYSIGELAAWKRWWVGVGGWVGGGGGLLAAGAQWQQESEGRLPCMLKVRRIMGVHYTCRQAILGHVPRMRHTLAYQACAHWCSSRPR